ncbi:MAG: transglutaminase domain-containing protein [Acidimicrobiaceae bacterium]|nr:transglutaminase domain-containing protein [Acidimicrobiaceae bacterium]
MNVLSTEFYATPGRHTDVTGFGLQVSSVEEAVRVVQGLLVYDLAAKDLYGVELTATQAGAVHERDAAALLELARTIDPRPLDQPRNPGERIGGRCNTYTLLTVALLRAAGVPARSRCGFGAYFVQGFYEDHWVAEYWDPEERRWTMVDAQLDDTWQRTIGMNASIPATVGPEQFLTAGHAWQAWRAGQLDADRCGLTSIDEHGAFWIAGNLRLDLAALNKVEMLPWDVWGLGWEPPEQPTSEMLASFDAIAALTIDPDHGLDDLLDRYESDPSFRMNGTVFSVALGEHQQV